MKTSALQQFLRSVGGALAEIGVQARSLEDLRAVADFLEPFRELELRQLADFLGRAAELRDSGQVPLVAVAGLQDAMDAARELGDAVQAFGAAGEDRIEAVTDRVAEHKRGFQSALGTLAKQFGLGVKFTDDKGWLPGLKSKAVVGRTAHVFRKLAPQIVSAESYQSEPVAAAVEQLAGLDANVIKAAAVELGAPVTGKSKGGQLVEAVLSKLTNVSPKAPPKATKKPKAVGPSATDDQVDAMVQELQTLLARAKDPKAVPDAEVDAILERVRNGFSVDQHKAIAYRVTAEKVPGKGAKATQTALDRLRADLTAVKRMVESQDV
jgi:hypothetical protein